MHGARDFILPITSRDFELESEVKMDAWIWCWRGRSYFCSVLQSFFILDFSFETVQSFYLFQNDVFNLICYFFYSSIYEDCGLAF